MKSKITFFALLIFFVTLAFSFEKSERLSLPADGLDELVIDCGSGFLSVTGEDSLKNIEVEAEIIVEGKNEKDMESYVEDYVKLELKKQGNKAVLTSMFKNSFPMISFRTRVINLTVTVPKDLDVEVDDGSGEMKIAQIHGDIQIDDGSGEITVRDIQGDVEIDDGSGTVEIESVSGNVTIGDGSGTIRVNDIGQNVRVSDGSGSIYIDTVGGDVIIKSDGSGGVNIQNVNGRVIK